MEEDQLKAWKLEYRDVYSAEVGDKEYFYRALTLKEIEDFDLTSADEGTAELEDLYVEAAVLSPIDWDRIKPGHITALSRLVERVSGLGDVSVILETFTEERLTAETDLTMMMKAFILAAIPSVTLQELDDSNIRQLIKVTALAEKVLTIQQQVSGMPNAGVEFDIVSDQGEQEQAVPRKASPPPPADKEELLRRIRKGNKLDSDAGPTDISQMESFDTDLLSKAAGYIAPEDPIARKLRESMGG